MKGLVYAVVIVAVLLQIEIVALLSLHNSNLAAWHEQMKLNDSLIGSIENICLNPL